MLKILALLRIKERHDFQASDDEAWGGPCHVLVPLIETGELVGKAGRGTGRVESHSGSVARAGSPQAAEGGGQCRMQQKDPKGLK